MSPRSIGEFFRLEREWDEASRHKDATHKLHLLSFLVPDFVNLAPMSSQAWYHERVMWYVIKQLLDNVAANNTTGEIIHTRLESNQHAWFSSSNNANNTNTRILSDSASDMMCMSQVLHVYLFLCVNESMPVNERYLSNHRRDSDLHTLADFQRKYPDEYARFKGYWSMCTQTYEHEEQVQIVTVLTLLMHYRTYMASHADFHQTWLDEFVTIVVKEEQDDTPKVSNTTTRVHPSFKYMKPNTEEWYKYSPDLRKFKINVDARTDGFAWFWLLHPVAPVLGTKKHESSEFVWEFSSPLTIAPTSLIDMNIFKRDECPLDLLSLIRNKSLETLGEYVATTLNHQQRLFCRVNFVRWPDLTLDTPLIMKVVSDEITLEGTVHSDAPTARFFNVCRDMVIKHVDDIVSLLSNPLLTMHKHEQIVLAAFVLLFYYRVPLAQRVSAPLRDKLNRCICRLAGVSDDAAFHTREASSTLGSDPQFDILSLIRCILAGRKYEKDEFTHASKNYDHITRVLTHIKTTTMPDTDKNRNRNRNRNKNKTKKSANRSQDHYTLVHVLYTLACCECLSDPPHLSDKAIRQRAQVYAWRVFGMREDIDCTFTCKNEETYTTCPELNIHRNGKDSVEKIATIVHWMPPAHASESLKEFYQHYVFAREKDDDAVLLVGVPFTDKYKYNIRLNLHTGVLTRQVKATIYMLAGNDIRAHVNGACNELLTLNPACHVWQAHASTERNDLLIEFYDQHFFQLTVRGDRVYVGHNMAVVNAQDTTPCILTRWVHDVPGALLLRDAHTLTYRILFWFGVSHECTMNAFGERAVIGYHAAAENNASKDTLLRMARFHTLALTSNGLYAMAHGDDSAGTLVPLAAYVTRLVAQKRFELVHALTDALLQAKLNDTTTTTTTTTTCPGDVVDHEWVNQLFDHVFRKGECASPYRLFYAYKFDLVEISHYGINDTNDNDSDPQECQKYSSSDKEWWHSALDDHTTATHGQRKDSCHHTADCDGSATAYLQA
jgi:hypothetical protein